MPPGWPCYLQAVRTAPKHRCPCCCRPSVALPRAAGEGCRRELPSPAFAHDARQAPPHRTDGAAQSAPQPAPARRGPWHFNAALCCRAPAPPSQIDPNGGAIKAEGLASLALTALTTHHDHDYPCRRRSRRRACARPSGQCACAGGCAALVVLARSRLLTILAFVSR